ncbi:hypothetical protein BGZ60DRAFT_532133 [Tricladium varicosporioides]|nr:hypothetical protein BGZ60DRAFT_532133 [Hymenoscyphus varicosporioides]
MAPGPFSLFPIVALFASQVATLTFITPDPARNNYVFSAGDKEIVRWNNQEILPEVFLNCTMNVSVEGKSITKTHSSVVMRNARSGHEYDVRWVPPDSKHNSCKLCAGPSAKDCSGCKFLVKSIQGHIIDANLAFRLQNRNPGWAIHTWDKFPPSSTSSSHQSHTRTGTAPHHKPSGTGDSTVTHSHHRPSQTGTTTSKHHGQGRPHHTPSGSWSAPTASPSDGASGCNRCNGTSWSMPTGIAPQSTPSLSTSISTTVTVTPLTLPTDGKISTTQTIAASSINSPPSAGPATSATSTPKPSPLSAGVSWSKNVEFAILGMSMVTAISFAIL